MFSVVVGNIGTVCSTDSQVEAKGCFDEYVQQSLMTKGRAAGEDVTMFQDEHIVAQFNHHSFIEEAYRRYTQA